MGTNRRMGGSFSLTTLQVHQTPIVPITVTGNNIELTPALNDYVNKKLDNIIGKLSTSGGVQDCNVHLTVNKNPKVSE
jgi:ribosome-associated translation inhibitor RaiA